MKSDLGSFKAINETAALLDQLNYTGRGNPPASHPETAVGNFFPGLEFNFQNVWKRIFIGIELLECSGKVIGVDENIKVIDSSEDLNGEHKRQELLDDLKRGYLIAIEYLSDDGKEHHVKLLQFAEAADGDGVPDKPADEEFLNVPHSFFLEWSNAFSKVHSELGGKEDRHVKCWFLVPDRAVGTGVRKFREIWVALRVRRLIDPGSAVISEQASKPGEITESLCSPWQTDYIGCSCFYWASNRPDYVNISDDGKSGHNWLNLSRVEDGGKPFYSLRKKELLQHEDVFQGWEHKLHFIVKSKDSPDGKASD